MTVQARSVTLALFALQANTPIVFWVMVVIVILLIGFLWERFSGASGSSRYDSQNIIRRQAKVLKQIEGDWVSLDEHGKVRQEMHWSRLDQNNMLGMYRQKINGVWSQYGICLLVVEGQSFVLRHKNFTHGLKEIDNLLPDPQARYQSGNARQMKLHSQVGRDLVETDKDVPFHFGSFVSRDRKGLRLSWRKSSANQTELVLSFHFPNEDVETSGTISNSIVIELSLKN